LKDWCNEQT